MNKKANYTHPQQFLMFFLFIAASFIWLHIQVT